MKDSSTPPDVAAKVVVRTFHFEISDELHSSIVERISRLAAGATPIDRIAIDLVRDPNSDEDHRFIAKGQVDFGGPALFTTVAAREPGPAADYLIDKLAHRLRRQRTPSAQSRAATPPTQEPAKPADSF